MTTRALPQSKKAKAFQMSGPGRYRMRNGDFVWIRDFEGGLFDADPDKNSGACILWLWTSDGARWKKDHEHDIVSRARTPAKPKAARRPKGNGRRYIAHHNGEEGSVWEVRTYCHRTFIDIIAHGMTRSTARKLAALLSAEVQ